VGEHRLAPVKLPCPRRPRPRNPKPSQPSSRPTAAGRSATLVIPISISAARPSCTGGCTASFTGACRFSRPARAISNRRRARPSSARLSRHHRNTKRGPCRATGSRRAGMRNANRGAMHAVNVSTVKTLRGPKCASTALPSRATAGPAAMIARARPAGTADRSMRELLFQIP
jgi:hypothetical protein